MVVKKEYIDIDGGQIPVTLEETEDAIEIKVDGVTWVVTTNPAHAAVLFAMFVDHITEYVYYKKK